jgi:predicted MFS family arabinose efflux permease
LRRGVKLVPKEERGRAYGVFFALFGLAWWVGSTAMGWFYDTSMTALVAFSVLTQLAAVPFLLVVGGRLRKLEAERR